MRYMLHLSNKQAIILDEDDFQKFLQVGERGQLVRLKQGIVNPSFVIAIVPAKVETQKRIEGHIDPETNAYIVDKEEEYTPELVDVFDQKLQIE